MGTIASLFAATYRDYNTDGVPASGAHEPLKSEIRAIGSAIEAAIATGALGSIDVAYATRAALDADLAWAAGSTALVYADATDANNDIYVKTGISGAGGWTLTSALHDIIGTLAQPYVDDAIAAAASALANFGRATRGSEIAFTDAKGRAAAVAAADGTFVAKRTRLRDVNGVRFDDVVRRVGRAMNPPPADYIGVISFGQSKSVGNGAGVSTFAAEIPDALMFNANGTGGAGPRAYEGSGGVAANHGSLIPLVEKLNAATGNGETGLGHFAIALNSLLLEENGTSLAGLGVKLVCSAAGESNTSIDSLDKPSTPYTRVLDDVTYGKSLASAAGRTYACPAILFAQGEYDIGVVPMSRATYKARLKQLRLDLDADIKAITGQSADVALILYQVSLVGTVDSEIGMAQLEAAAEDPLIIISHPDYAVPFTAPGNTHHSSAGYAIQGAYFARAWKRKVFDGNVSRLTLAQSGQILRNGNVLTVPFSVPVPPLRSTTDFFPAQTNLGFYATKVDTSPNVITGVTVLRDRVRITLTSAEAGTLFYGQGAGYGGNLADSDMRDAETFVRRAMSNPALLFEKTFA